MTKKMLIDAANEEEVRVCLLENGKVEDFDFESASRRPLRGNIYLARVTRVEPSLQAAFVEYGGNRHGFLAFSEIHPDYYQIPVSDREKLRAAEQEEARLASLLNIQQDADEDHPQSGLDDDLEGDLGDEEVQETTDRPKGRGRRRRSDPASRRGQAASAETIESDGTDDASDLRADADVDLDSEAERAASDHDDADSVTARSSLGEDYADIDDDNNEDVDDEEEEEEENESDAADHGGSDEDGDQARRDRALKAADDDGDNEFVDEDTADYGDDSDPDDIRLFDETDSDDDIEASDHDADDDRDDDDADEDEEDGDEDEDEVLDSKSRAALLEEYREARRNRARLLRGYKIQEVVKRRQILLVQVVKEERGNKGAALTTYLSLAGRYCVLMPNTARGGGISRKISNASDRKRLRRIVNDLDVPQGMGLIVRTAGSTRSKSEIKRDYDYLTRLWDSIRELTLKSIAPCLIYEEASLIKRAIRDLYDKDINEVLVDGDSGYREAKDFMKMLMPSHARFVQPYKDQTPLFLRYDVERQLDAMYQPIVRLKSGGYVVINQTEALIAIDVNSGKATRERNIEQTALKTNLEAAREVARQCRLRDLAGLLVIDFIDMEENRNNRAVEKRLKDALKADRARIQVGRISGFGLLEMSRQRRRSGIVDGTTHACPSCNGAGVIRSNEMAALRILRAIEAEVITGRIGGVRVSASHDVALYMLNHKRDWLRRIETTYEVAIQVQIDPEKVGDRFEIEKTGPERERPARVTAIRADLSEPSASNDDIEEIDVSSDDDEARDTAAEDGFDDAGGKRKRRRRRRRRDREGDDATASVDEQVASDDQDADDTDDGSDPEAAGENEDDTDSRNRKRRRRGRRGGRRNRRSGERDDDAQQASDDKIETPAGDGLADSAGVMAATSAEEEAIASQSSQPSIAASVEPASTPATVDSTPPHEDIVATDISPPESDGAGTPQTALQTDGEPKKARKGWWQRALGG